MFTLEKIKRTIKHSQEMFCIRFSFKWYMCILIFQIYAHIMESVGFRVHRTKIMDFTYKFEKKNEHKGTFVVLLRSYLSL